MVHPRRFFKWLKDTRFGMHFCSKKCGVPTMFQPYIFRCENVSLHHFSRVFRPRTESDKWYIDLGSCSNQPVDCWIKISLSSPSWSPSNKTPHVSLYAPRFAGANVEPKLENVSLEKLRIFGPPCPPPPAQKKSFRWPNMHPRQKKQRLAVSTLRTYTVVFPGSMAHFVPLPSYSGHEFVCKGLWLQSKTHGVVWLEFHHWNTGLFNDGIHIS